MSLMAAALGNQCYSKKAVCADWERQERAIDCKGAFSLKGGWLGTQFTLPAFKFGVVFEIQLWSEKLGILSHIIGVVSSDSPEI